MNNTDRKKLLGFILSGALILGMWVPVGVRAGEAGDTFKADMKTHKDIFDGTPDQYKGKTVILHSNDVHGQIDGYAYIAELEDDFEEAGAEVITMDAGDYTQGTPYVSTLKGASAIELMNLAGYEFVTLGNHEFDYGWAQLKSNLQSAKFSVLCADVLEDGKTIYNADAIYTTKSGVKIGIFGLETPETKTKTNPAQIKGLTYLSNSGGKTELYDCAKKEVETLKSRGADIVISLAHLGMDEESKGDGHRSVDLYSNVSGINIILDGHSHDIMTEGPSGEPIQSTGTKFDNIGVVVIDDSKKAISEHYLVDTEGLDKDEETEAAAKVIIDKIDSEYGTVFAKSKVSFASQKTENRCYETNTGDLITDAMMWEISKHLDEIYVDKENIIAVTNSGGIRAGLSVGDVTKKDINTILPFDNTLAVVYVSGAELLEALEASTYSSPEAVGGYPQTKGIKLTIDTSKPYDQGELYPNSTYYKPKTIQRVTIESINGKPFETDKKYAVITNDFCAVGGDTYYAFKASAAAFDTGFPLDEVVTDYITTELKGVLSVKRYGKSRDDVTITPAPEMTTYEVSNPDGTALKKLTAAKNKLTVTWNKTADDVDNYQIQYSTTKKFTKKTTKSTVVSAKKAKVVLKKLKSKKTYYVRIRTSMKWEGKTLTSEWSKVKKAKVA